LTKKFRKENNSSKQLNLGIRRKIKMSFNAKENIDGCFSVNDFDKEDINDLENDDFKKPSLDNLIRVKEFKK